MKNPETKVCILPDFRDNFSGLTFQAFLPHLMLLMPLTLMFHSGFSGHHVVQAPCASADHFLSVSPRGPCSLQFLSKSCSSGPFPYNQGLNFAGHFWIIVWSQETSLLFSFCFHVCCHLVRKGTQLGVLGFLNARLLTKFGIWQQIKNN